MAHIVKAFTKVSPLSLENPTKSFLNKLSVVVIWEHLKASFFILLSKARNIFSYDLGRLKLRFHSSPTKEHKLPFRELQSWPSLRAVKKGKEKSFGRKIALGAYKKFSCLPFTPPSCVSLESKHNLKENIWLGKLIPFNSPADGDGRKEKLSYALLLIISINLRRKRKEHQ